jgi:demethylmenaquinone methyltransferase/2-methoxy-6-polyprenyl-1,4-benzoquinol methylase
MLSMGEIKMKKRGFDQVIEMKLGDSEALPFENDSFDAITVGFGVRNFENLTLGLSEMLRVTRKDGKIIILEFSKPKKFPVKQAFYLYSKYFIPFFGKRISKDAKAYSYLPESVAAFPEGEEFKNILSQIGYRNVQSKLVSGGIATIYIAEK